MIVVDVTLDVLDHDDRVVDDEAGGERDAEQRQGVDREAEQLHEREGTDQRDRDGDGRYQRGPPVLQEQEHDDDDQPHRFEQGGDDLANRFRDDPCGVVRQLDFQAGRVARGQALERGGDAGVDRQGVGGRQLRDAEAEGIAAVVAKRRRVAFRAELRTPDILEAHQSPAARPLQDDVGELVGLGEAADGADADLIGLAGPGRRGADLSRGHLHVLLAQRLHDFVGGNVPAGETIRIEPQPHGVLAIAEDLHARHSGDALDLVLDEPIDVVAEEQRVVLVVVREHRGGEHDVVAALGHRNADGLDLVRQPSFDLGHPILHIDGSDVDVAVHVEGDGDAGGAIAAARRGHVLQALDAVQGLFDRNGDGRLHHLGARSLIERGDLHGRRRQLRELGDWQARNHDQAADDDDQRAHAGQDRPADERVGNHH